MPIISYTKEQVIDLVKTNVGYPIFSYIELSDDQIEKMFIDRALSEYFRAFPLTTYKSVASGAILKYSDFPENSLGIINVQFVYHIEVPPVRFDDAFSLTKRLFPGIRVHKFVEPHAIYERLLAHTAAKPSYAVINDSVKKEIKFSSFYSGTFEIIIGCKGKVEDVQPNYIWDFVDLAGAYLKKYLGSIRNIITIPEGVVKPNFANWEKNADEVIEKIRSKWIPVNFAIMWG